jgi:hypothetical protein
MGRPPHRSGRPRWTSALVPALAALSGLVMAGCSSQPPLSATVPSTTVPSTTVPSTTALSSPASSARPAATPKPKAAVPRARLPLGVYEPSEAASWSAVAAFGRQAGQPVKYVVTYLGQDDPFPATLSQQAAAHGAELILQLEPTMSMARVAAGNDDAYLNQLARDISAVGDPLIVSWAAEANGNWYSYGATRTPVADYRAAWAHVMSRFAGVREVTWMDTINRTYQGAGRTSDYVIPGVSLYGIDAYYSSAGDTFGSVFKPTLAQIRAVTSKPVMVSETGIGPVAGQVRSIPGLVKGVRASHLAGLVYFDSSQGNSSPYHQDWALSAAAMKALRTALAGK